MEDESSPISSSYATPPQPQPQQRNQDVYNKEEDEEAQHMIVLPNAVTTSKRQLKTTRGISVRTVMGCGSVFVLAIALAVLIVRLEWEPPTATTTNNKDTKVVAEELTLPLEQNVVVVTPSDDDEEDKVPCIPEFCRTPKQFIKAEEFIILNSYPGSGSTWVRQLSTCLF